MTKLLTCPTMVLDLDTKVTYFVLTRCTDFSFTTFEHIPFSVNDKIVLKADYNILHLKNWTVSKTDIAV